MKRVLAALLAVAGIGGISVAIITWHPKPKPVTIFALPEITVTQAADGSDQMLAAKDFEGLTRLATIWLRRSPKPDEAEAYTRLLLNCLTARKLRSSGDLMVLLEAADPYLDHLDGTIYSKRLTTYAVEFEKLGLLRRAKILFEQSSPQDRKQITRLGIALRRFGASKPSNDQWGSEASLITRLGDVLKAPPINGIYDYESVPKGVQRLDDDPKNPPEQMSSGPLLLSLYKGTNLERDDDDADSIFDKPLQRVDVPTQQRLTVNDLRVLSLNDYGVGSIQTKVIQHLLLVAGYDAKIVANFAPISVQHIAETWFIYGNSDDHVYAIAYLNNAKPRIWTTSYDLSYAQGGLIDLFGDGKQLAVVLYCVGGAMSVRDEAFFSLNDGHILWSGGSYVNGNVTPLHLTDGDSVELLVQQKTDIMTVDCLRCPALMETTIFELHRGQRAFRLVARRNSDAELNRGSGGGLLAVSPSIVVSDYADGIWPKIAGLRSNPRGMARKAFAEAISDGMDYANSLQDAGAFQQAVRIYQVLAVAETLRADKAHDERMVSSITFQLAQSFYQGGDYDNARKTLERSEPLAVMKHGGDDAVSYLNLASMVDLQTGHLGIAYEKMQKALAFSQVHKGPLLGNQALYFLRTGDFQSAYNSATQALDALISEAARKPKKDDDDFDEDANPLTTMDAALDMVWAATSAEQLGKSGVAADWLLRAYRITRSQDDSSGGLQTYAAEVAASAALALGNPSLALDFLDDSLGVAESWGWSDNGGGFLVLYGRALAAQGLTSVAGKVWTIAATLSRSSSYNDYISAQLELAKLAQSSGDSPLALAHAEEAFAEISRGRLEISTEKQKMSFLADKKEVTELLLTLYVQSNRSAAEILRVIEGWKLRAFLDLYSAHGKNLARQPRSAVSMQGEGEFLSTDEAFVDFFIGKDLSLAVVMRKGRMPVAYRLSSGSGETINLANNIRSEMDVHVAATLDAIQSGKVPDTLKAELRRGYDDFIRPLTNSLSGLNRIIISPDESMFGIPWSALRDGEVSVLDRYETVIAPSANVFQQGISQPRQPHPSGRDSGSSLVVGEFNAVPIAEVIKTIPPADRVGDLTGLPALKYGQAEVKKVGSELANIGTTKFFLDSPDMGNESHNTLGKPTPSALLKQFPNFNIVHITAHGIFSSSDPMSSSLFLADESGKRILAARELLDLPLQHVDLVTLAACQTAVSTRGTSAEPFGFQRALLGAGVSSTLLTGWEIDDSTSADLCPKFYRHLRTSSKSEALRRAQMDIRRSHPHPYFWASAELYGQPD